MFGRHPFVNLSSEFRELVLESECQVFVKGKSQVPSLCIEYQMLCVQREFPRYCTCGVSISRHRADKVSVPWYYAYKVRRPFVPQRLTVKLGDTSD